MLAVDVATIHVERGLLGNGFSLRLGLDVWTDLHRAQAKKRLTFKLLKDKTVSLPYDIKQFYNIYFTEHYQPELKWLLEDNKQRYCLY